MSCSGCRPASAPHHRDRHGSQLGAPSNRLVAPSKVHARRGQDEPGALAPLDRHVIGLAIDDVARIPRRIANHGGLGDECDESEPNVSAEAESASGNAYRKQTVTLMKWSCPREYILSLFGSGDFLNE